ncbi:MAG: PD40 domain-containing protein [Deltaproteobacteria bacterium]|nr:PD40 domain-containing protein [Deltaproteobacteria bacterium]
MGALPTAVTSAEPLWVPFRVIAGTSVERDLREAHFGDLRRLTTGGMGGAPTWTADGRSLRYVAPDDCRVQLTVELDSGRIKRTEFAKALESVVTEDGLLEAECERASSPEARSAAKSLSASEPTALLAPAPVAIGGITNPRSRPTFSHDHAWLAWQARADGAAEGTSAIFLSTSSGARPHAITRDGRANVHPTFTRKGRVLYASDRDAAPGGSSLALHLVDPEGPATASGGPRVERVSWGSGERAPRVSPDGSWLAFLSTRGGAGWDLYVARWLD